MALSYLRNKLKKPMQVGTRDQKHLLAAHGYLGLGMFNEANTELEAINPLGREFPEVLGTRVEICRALEKWELMVIAAKELAERNPDEPVNFVNWAYASRRAESIHIAHAILLRAEELHPDNGSIQFNLACYEAQMGDIDKAESHLSLATKADPQFALLALNDADLLPLWFN